MSRDPDDAQLDAYFFSASVIVSCMFICMCIIAVAIAWWKT